MITDEIRKSIIVFNNGIGNIQEAHNCICEFLELDFGKQHDVLSDLLNSNEPIISAYGWKLADTIVKTRSKGNVVDEMKNLVEELYSKGVEDETVTCLKSACISAIMAKSVISEIDNSENIIENYMEFLTKNAEKDVDLGIQAILIWKNFLMDAIDNDGLNKLEKSKIRFSILKTICPNVLLILRSYRSIDDIVKRNKLYAAFTSFLKSLSLTMPSCGSNDVIEDVFNELIFLLENFNNFSAHIKILMFESYTTIINLRYKNIQEVLAIPEIAQNIGAMWNLLCFSDDPNLYNEPVDEAVLEIILSYSEYLAHVHKQRKTSPNVTNNIFNIFVNSISLTNDHFITRKRILTQVLKSLKILGECNIDALNKLFCLLQLMLDYNNLVKYTIPVEDLIERNFWNVTVDSIRLLFNDEMHSSESVKSFINNCLTLSINDHLIGNVQVQSVFERIFKILRVLKNSDKSLLSCMIEFSQKLDEKLMEIRKSLSGDIDNDMQIYIQFLINIKFSIDSYMYKFDEYKEKIMDHLMKLVDILEWSRIKSCVQIVYILSAVLHVTIEDYGEYLKENINCEQFLSVLVPQLQKLSILQAIPFIEEIIQLKYDHPIAKRFIDWLLEFKFAENIDQFLAEQLGFDVEEPTEQQISNRREYRSALLLLRILLKKLTYEDKVILMEKIVIPLFKFMPVLNVAPVWKGYHHSYELEMTKNDLFVVGADVEEYNDTASSQDRNPNRLLESLSDLIFQIFELMGTSGLPDLVKEPNLQSLVFHSMCIPLESMDLSYRRWYIKGMKSILQCCDLNTVDESLFLMFLKNFFENGIQILAKYEKIDIAPTGCPVANTDSETLNNYVYIKLSYDFYGSVPALLTVANNDDLSDMGKLILSRDDCRECLISFLRMAVQINHPDGIRIIMRLIYRILKYLYSLPIAPSSIIVDFYVIYADIVNKYRSDDDLKMFITSVARLVAEHGQREVLCPIFIERLNEEAKSDINKSILGKIFKKDLASMMDITT